VLVWTGVGILVAILLAGAGVAARRGSGPTPAKQTAAKKEQSPPAPVELTAVRRGEIATFLQNTTTLEARNIAGLIARRQGQVVSLLAEEGQWVQRGRPLAKLDDREERLAVERAELGADVAEREFDRASQLSHSGFLSKKELDDLEVRKRNAWVELEQARLELSQMVITAPFSGRVIERSVQLGETVTVGKECFRLADFHPLIARLYFPERELTRVRVGQPAMLTLDSQPGQDFAARVSLVNPVVDRANGTFKVTLEVSNAAGSLRPGAFAHARLKTGEYPNALLLPRRGVLSEDGEDYVFVARGDSVTRVSIRLGAVEGDTAQIVAGLAAGDRVVTVGQGGLRPGAKIKAVTL
jgi:membrane fusion protein (multidrug efflux system)